MEMTTDKGTSALAEYTRANKRHRKPQPARRIGDSEDGGYARTLVLAMIAGALEYIRQGCDFELDWLLSDEPQELLGAAGLSGYDLGVVRARAGAWYRKAPKAGKICTCPYHQARRDQAQLPLPLPELEAA